MRSVPIPIRWVRTVGVEIVAVDIVDVAVAIVVNIIVGNLAGVGPHVVAERWVVHVHASIDDSNDWTKACEDRGRPRRLEPTPLEAGAIPCLSGQRNPAIHLCKTSLTFFDLVDFGADFSSWH